MKVGLFFGIVCAIVLHAGFLLFGGLLFIGLKDDEAVLQVVELMSADEVAEKEKEKPEEAEAEKTEALEAEREEAPDAAEMIRSLDLSDVPVVPELEAASLSAIEAALNGLTSGVGDFTQSLDFASGGRIGGTGKAGAVSEELENAFSVTDIDQGPRLIFQAAPAYPASMRGKKVEGAVTVKFIVDVAGKATSPRVEESSNVVFEKPALDAVRNSKFEPAIKAGKPFPWKMRVTVRFKPS